MNYTTRRTGLFRASALIAGAVVLAAASGPLEGAESQRESNSRSGSVTRSSVSSKSVGASSTSRSSSRSASSTRSTGSSGHRETATRKPSNRPPSAHYPSGRHYYGGSWGWGWGFGYYPWGYWGHYYPYYPIYPTIYYGAYPVVEYRDLRLGAVDLNVKPKKTEVWVDGQLVGMSGKFDGFPGYLWLERGPHTVAFFRPGFRTEVREIRVLQGAAVRIHLRLEEGESTHPTDLAAEVRASAVRGVPGKKGESGGGRETQALRVEPGRLRMSIEPEDASVYLDGRFLGTAKELSELHAGLLVGEGDHVLEVVRPGYRSERIGLVIEADTESAIAMTLEAE